MTKESPLGSPLLDADWLLGSPDHRDQRGRARHTVFSQICGGLMMVAIGVWGWPYLSRAWLQKQFVQQVEIAKSIDEKVPAITGLAAMLPETLPQLIHSLNNPDKQTSQVAYRVLDNYLGEVLAKPNDARVASLADVVHQLDCNVATFGPESQILVRALVTRIHASQVDSSSRPSAILVSQCRKLMQQNDAALKIEETSLANNNDNAKNYGNLKNTIVTPVITPEMSDVASEPITEPVKDEKIVCLQER